MADADKDKTPEGSLDGLPPGISGAYRTVSLPTSGKAVIVQKWSFTRARLVMDQLADGLDGMSIDKLKEAHAGGLKAMVKLVLDKLGHQAIEVVRVSVHEDSRALIHPEMDFEDFVEALDAVVEMNITERMSKKVQGLASRFQALRAKGSSSQ